MTSYRKMAVRRIGSLEFSVAGPIPFKSPEHAFHRAARLVSSIIGTVVHLISCSSLGSSKFRGRIPATSPYGAAETSTTWLVMCGTVERPSITRESTTIAAPERLAGAESHSIFLLRSTWALPSEVHRINLLL